MFGRLLHRGIGLALALWVFSTPTFGQETRRYVNSPGDLKVHFTTHIKRVSRLGVELYDSHPDLFPGVTREDVREFLAVHDQTKIDDREEFRRSFWVEKAEAAFIDRLYFLYGKGYGFAADPANAAWTGVISSLNATDRRVAMDYFRRRGLLAADGEPTERAKTLLRIERLADVVDRNSDPVAMEEFNIKEQRPLGEFIRDPVDLILAQELKQKYRATVKGLEYASGPHGALTPCRDLGWRYQDSQSP